jgi:hypothetical protein
LRQIFVKMLEERYKRRERGKAQER